MFYYISRFIDETHIKQIYFAYVFPHIKYGIEIYGKCPKYNIKRIQMVQNRLLRILCKKNKRDSATELHQNLKLLKVEQMHSIFVANFVYNILYIIYCI